MMVLHFTIGASTMINKLLILCALILFSCSTKSIKEEIPKPESENIYLKSYIFYFPLQKEYILDINFMIKKNKFVFIKRDSLFSAKVNISLRVMNLDSENMFINRDWFEVFTEDSFDAHRLSSNFYNFSERYSVPEGEYELTVLIEDLDSGDIWKKKDTVKIAPLNGLGEIILYSDISRTKIIGNDYNITNNKLFLSVQYIEDGIPPELIYVDYTIKNYKTKYPKTEIIVSHTVNGEYHFDMELNENVYGETEFEINVNGYKKILNLFVNDESYNLWTKDVFEVIGVMRYILPTHEIKKIKKMEDRDKLKYIQNYWFKRDPELETEQNELLIEFINRVRYVNTHFSDMDRGWRTDRGRIYIIYGPPERIESYEDQMNNRFEIWIYPNRKEFKFIDKNKFGFYRQILG